MKGIFPVLSSPEKMAFENQHNFYVFRDHMALEQRHITGNTNNPGTYYAAESTETNAETAFLKNTIY